MPQPTSKVRSGGRREANGSWWLPVGAALMLAAGCGEGDAPASPAEVTGQTAAAVSPLCNVGGVRIFRPPLDGVNGVNWMINNYVDLDPAAGKLKDYTGRVGSLARTIDGHAGIDFDIPSMRQMDTDEAVVYSMTFGKVIEVVQGNSDRQIVDCAPGTGRDANRVVIQTGAASQFTLRYLHLKKNSVRVRVDDLVSPGTVLGIAGSSGCSTAAHLHFDVSCEGAILETLSQTGVWDNPPEYNPPSNLMDLIIRAGGTMTTAQVKDSPPDTLRLAPTSQVGFALSLTTRRGDQPTVVVRKPSGQLFAVMQLPSGDPGSDRLFHSFLPFPAGGLFNDELGTWRVAAGFDFDERFVKTFEVGNDSSRHAIPLNHPSPHYRFQNVFNEESRAGFKPFWVDGYSVNGATFYNLLSRASSDATTAFTDMSASAFSTAIMNQSGGGFRLIQQDSYMLNGQPVFSGIFDQSFVVDQRDYHGVSAATHQSRFNTNVAQGFRPVNIAVLVVGGQRQFSALYEKAPVGNLIATITSVAQFQSVFDTNRNAGRTVAYLDAFTENGVPMLSVIFDAQDRGLVQVRHGLTAQQYADEQAVQRSNGLVARRVTGYQDTDGVTRFAAMWSSR